MKRKMREGERIQQCMNRALNSNKTTWKIQILNVFPQLEWEMIGKYDGQSRNGIVCDLKYNANKTRFDTGPDGYPLWAFYDQINNGQPYTMFFKRRQINARACNIRARKMGVESDKLEYQGRFKTENTPNFWQLLL